MRYGSVCSGVEAATVAWHDIEGWAPEWFCEFEKFPSAVLAHHYPDVPNLHDMTKIHERKIYHERPINLLVGGTPCQSFSIAGLRKGLDDDRGNLALKFCQILRDKQPRWFVWENVPGVLSSNEGRDFAAILSGFSECGYGFAYRIYDAQYFGVPQRRRRVFVVGYLGDWRPAAAVLFEQDSLYGNPAPRREKRERIAPTVTTGPPFSRTGNDRVEAEAMIPVKNGSHWDGSAHPSLSQSHNTGVIRQSNQEIFSQRGAGLVSHIDGKDIARTLKARHDGSPDAEGGDLGGGSETLISQEVANCLQTTCDDYSRADGFNMVVHGTQDPCVLEDKAHTLGRNGGQENAICYSAKLSHTGSNGIGVDEELGYTLDATNNCNQAVVNKLAVRRLTPVECERLQGFPDNYTLIDYSKRASFDKISDDVRKYYERTGFSGEKLIRAALCPDGPRYKAMGNSMAVPVMRWIGRRIDMVDKIMAKIENR